MGWEISEHSFTDLSYLVKAHNNVHYFTLESGCQILWLVKKLMEYNLLFISFNGGQVRYKALIDPRCLNKDNLSQLED